MNTFASVLALTVLSFFLFIISCFINCLDTNFTSTGLARPPDFPTLWATDISLDCIMTSILFAIDMIFLIRSTSDSSAVSPSTPKTLIDSLLNTVPFHRVEIVAVILVSGAFSNRFSIIDTDFSIALLTASVTAAVTAPTITGISCCIRACTSILSWVFTPKPAAAASHMCQAFRDNLLNSCLQLVTVGI